MKTVIIGDIHGKSVWKLILNIEKPDRVVFIGDYFDSYENFTAAEQIHNFKEIIEYKESCSCEVVLLIGNHDHHYFPEMGPSKTSGYQTSAAPAISHAIDENRGHLKMAYQFDNILCTHAGVSEVFLKKTGWTPDDNISEFLNDLFKYKPQSFSFGHYIPDDTYYDPYGDDPRQSCIWIRPRSLMKGAADFKKNIIQIVGHTNQKKIDIKGASTGGRYYFIDTLDTSGEYLIIENGEIKSGSIK